jgi:hypothetical protein
LSTYYYFACDRCKEYGGWFSRQAWGWGNMDIVDTFAFLANHADHVDHYQEGLELRVISEHDTYTLHREGWTKTVNREDADDGLADYERVADYELITFPHSGDWEKHEELFAAYRERHQKESE